MCIDIMVHIGNSIMVECSTQGELAAALGGQGCIIYSKKDRKPTFDPELCLCPVDMKLTAENRGFRYVPPGRYTENGKPDFWYGHFIPLPEKASLQPKK